MAISVFLCPNPECEEEISLTTKLFVKYILCPHCNKKVKIPAFLKKPKNNKPKCFRRAFRRRNFNY